jgi:hypothetical protein
VLDGPLAGGEPTTTIDLNAGADSNVDVLTASDAGFEIDRTDSLTAELLDNSV